MSAESACFDYGSARGCDEHCPALLNGECPNIKEAAPMLDLCDEDFIDIMRFNSVSDNDIKELMQHRC